MDPEVVLYSLPASSIKIRRRETRDMQVAAKLLLRSQRFKASTADTFVEEPWRNFETIDRTFKNAPDHYKYQPIHGLNSIRLIELLPGGPGEIIRINLLT